eukprot:3499260-Pyramimonas_sp.AAC.1
MQRQPPAGAPEEHAQAVHLHAGQRLVRRSADLQGRQQWVEPRLPIEEDALVVDARLPGPLATLVQQQPEEL